MSAGGTARLGACLFLVIFVSALAAAANGRGGSPDTGWREPLQRVEPALARGDTRGAVQAWEMAYRAAMGGRTPEGMIEVGHAALRMGVASQNHQAAMAQARRLFLAALFQARERRDPGTVARAGEAFASLGDRDVAVRAFEIAATLATQNAGRGSGGR